MAGLKSYDFTAIPPVLVNENGKKAPRSLELDATKVTGFTGTFDREQKIIYPGAFLGSAGTKVRPLPRTKLTALLTNGVTTTVGAATNTARHFVATDVIKVIAPYAKFTFALTWAAADTANAVIDGVTVTTTAVGADLAVEAAAMAAAINANAYLSGKVTAIADGTDTVYVYANDFVSYYTTTASETTAGDGTFAAGAAAMSGGATIGTVSSVDAETDSITLVAASAIDLPAGMPIGVATSLPYDSSGGFGMLSPNEAIDLNYGSTTVAGAWIGCTVYEDRLPYIDDQLKGLFPEMVFI